MAKRKRGVTKKQKKEALEGEIFYKAHPIAGSMTRSREVSLVPLTIEKLLWWVLSLAEVILIIRLVLATFGAVGGSAFTAFLYAISYPFVWFFFYLFNSLGSINVVSPRFELETLAAMAFYYIIIYIITALISVFSGIE